MNVVIKKYPPPKNCLFAYLSKLNLDIRDSLQSTGVKRDASIVGKQEKIIAAATAVGALLNELFADSWRDERVIKRNLTLANLNSNFRNT